jgi:hypothetical protein
MRKSVQTLLLRGTEYTPFFLKGMNSIAESIPPEESMPRNSLLPVAIHFLNTTLAFLFMQSLISGLIDRFQAAATLSYF